MVRSQRRPRSASSLLAAVAAAVSLLPASLIAVVSLTLANASNDLAKRKALVRRMDAVEGIAQVNDVCSDKVRCV